MEKGGYGKKYRVVKNSYANGTSKWIVEWKFERLGFLNRFAPWLSLRDYTQPFDAPYTFASAEAAGAKVDECLRKDSASQLVERKVENL